MSTLGKYFIRGKFEGHFTTDQEKALRTGDLLPEGKEHRVQIYRGLITESVAITQEEFTQSQGNYHFKQINNIQINKSPNWPVPNDRIYSLNDLILTNLEISNVELFENKSTGILRGDVVGSVSEGSFSAGKNQDPYHPGKGAKPFNPDNNNGNNTNSGNDLGSTGESEPGIPGSGENKGCNRINQRGCNTKWLRWLLLLLIILFLLYLLSKCTKIGRNLYCKYDNWRTENKIKEVKEEMDTLYNKMRRTETVAVPCGKTINHIGKNEYWDTRFYIGNQSGRLSINFDAKPIPDRLEVIYDGELVAETNMAYIKGHTELNGKGFQTGDTTLFFNYKYDKHKPTELLLRVIPNKTSASTQWTLKLNCPQ